MLKVGKIIGETVLSLAKPQMIGEINLIEPIHPILGEILHLAQGNPNPNCDGTRANGRKAHPIGGITLM